MDVQTKIVAVINTKGGVGKTSTCHHLSAPLLELTKAELHNNGLTRQPRMLLADLDFQGNLSRGLLGPNAISTLPYQVTTAAFFDDHLTPTPDELIHKTPIEGIDIIPASRQLEDFTFPKPQTLGEYQFVLRTFLEELIGLYDYVFLDCHPSLDLVSWNALCAASFVLCPFQPEDYGAQGISRIQEAIDLAVRTTNPRLRLLGYVLNKVRNTGLHKTFTTLLREYYGDDVFDTVIPDSILLPEAVTNRLPISCYKPRVKAAKAINRLSQELIERVPRVQSAPHRYLYMGNQAHTA